MSKILDISYKVFYIYHPSAGQNYLLQNRIKPAYSHWKHRHANIQLLQYIHDFINI